MQSSAALHVLRLVVPCPDTFAAFPNRTLKLLSHITLKLKSTIVVVSCQRQNSLGRAALTASASTAATARRSPGRVRWPTAHRHRPQPVSAWMVKIRAAS